MNCFKRKAYTLAILAGLALLSGCGLFNPSEEKQAQVAEAKASQERIVTMRTAEANATIEREKTNAVLYDKLDAGGAAAILLVEKMKGLGVGAQAAPVQVVQPPQSLLGLAWQSLLQVADLGLRAYGIKANRDINVIQSNNNREVALSTNATFGAFGQSIATAGTAGYPYVQAPGAVITNTLSGTGVLGSGTYTAPVTTTTTTTHTCQGGTAAGGGAGGTGTTAGGAGAAGGSSPGGNC